MTVEAFKAALEQLQPPPESDRWDCNAWAPLVTSALRSANLPARTVTVWGWHDATKTLLWFAHRATQCDDYIIDLTAGQFHRDLTGTVVMSVTEYITRLALVTGATEVTIK